MDYHLKETYNFWSVKIKYWFSLLANSHVCEVLSSFLCAYDIFECKTLSNSFFKSTIFNLMPLTHISSLSSGKHVHEKYKYTPSYPLYIAYLYIGVYLFFLILFQNIDCGYSLEPPRRGGSNMFPQSMF